MKLFKILFCNYVYFHRHSIWGHKNDPVFFTFCMFFLALLCYAFFCGILWSIWVMQIPLSGFGTLFYLIIPLFVVILYWRLVGNKRYIGILKNRKYYSKTCKVISFLFMAMAVVCLWATGYLMWADNNGLI